MLGVETERRLKYFLDDVKQGEEQQEMKRQRLSYNRDFAPLSAFMRIDRNVNDSISAYEILSFLRDNKEYCITEQECNLLVKYFDSDNDDKLTY